MNIFLKNTVLFSCFILAFFSINCIVNLYLISNAKINLDNKNIIAIGDSHFENGLIEDSLTACVSFAKNSDSYELMYYKLKTALIKKMISHYSTICFITTGLHFMMTTNIWINGIRNQHSTLSLH